MSRPRERSGSWNRLAADQGPCLARTSKSALLAGGAIELDPPADDAPGHAPLANRNGACFTQCLPLRVSAAIRKLGRKALINAIDAGFRSTGRARGGQEFLAMPSMPGPRRLSASGFIGVSASGNTNRYRRTASRACRTRASRRDRDSVLGRQYCGHRSPGACVRERQSRPY